MSLTVQSILDAYLASQAQDRHLDRVALEKPILTPLNKITEVDLVVTNTGKAMLVYEKALPDYIWWAEYDPEIAQLYLVTVGGQIMDFGQKIHPDTHKVLKNADRIFLVQIAEDGTPVDVAERKLTVRKGLN